MAKKNRDYPLSTTPTPERIKSLLAERNNTKPSPFSMRGTNVTYDKSIGLKSGSIDVGASKSISDKSKSAYVSANIGTKKGGNINVYADTDKNVEAGYSSPSGKNIRATYSRGGSYGISAGSPSAGVSYDSDKNLGGYYYTKSGKRISGSYNLQDKSGMISASIPIKKKKYGKS